MSYWAELDHNNKVIRVTVGNDDEADNGYQWLVDNLGGTWIQTSMTGSIRKNYAGIGYEYDVVRDAFIPPKCHEIAIINEASCLWTCEDSSHEAKTK